jgi:hypothetical protein
MSDAWTNDDWMAWRADNRRLIQEGWELQMIQKTDGTVEWWANKGDLSIQRRTPPSTTIEE